MSTTVTLTGTGVPHPAPGRAGSGTLVRHGDVALHAGTRFEQIFSYHADTVPLGGLAARAGVPHVVLTHLIPAPSSPEQEAAFVQDLRDGGYAGEVTVGHDLMTFPLG